MIPTDERDKKIVVERRLLAALCQGSLGAQARADLLQRLDAHKFATPDHEVMFQALRTLPPGNIGRVREALAAAVTRMGFPDMDLEPLFHTPAAAGNDLPALLDEL
jgi:hypothetical protein